MSVYRGCSLFQNGFEISDSLSYTPPEIAIERAWFKAGAMNAPVAVDRGTKAMTATYKFSGHGFSPYLFFGYIPGVKARLTVRRAFSSDEGMDYLEDELEGFIDTIRADECGESDRDKVGHTMIMSINYYKVSLNGIMPLLEINAELGLRKVMGVNVLGIPNNILNLVL